MPYSTYIAATPYGAGTYGSVMYGVNSIAAFVVAGSLQIDSSIGRRSQASLTVYSDANTHFQQYQQVAIYDSNNVLVFSGYITNPQEQKPGFQSSLIHTLTCADQHFL